MSELAGKRVVVVGLGASGVAAARLCLRRGARVVANDGKPREALSDEARGARGRWAPTLVAGGHAAARMDEADLVVVSPGVPPLPEVAAAERAGVAGLGRGRARGALDDAPGAGRRHRRHQRQEHHDLARRAPCSRRTGTRTFVGGNLGEPLADHADERFDVVVLEVSSFQMERVDTFHARTSARCSTSPTTTSTATRASTTYARAKGNAFVRQTADDWAVVPVGDATCLARGEARAAGAS